MEDRKSMIPEGAARWEPELGPEAQAYADCLRAEVRPRIMLMLKVREALGMTQIEAARVMSITQGGVSKRERAIPSGLMAIRDMAHAKGARLRLALELADGTVVDLSDDIEAIQPPEVLRDLTAP